MQQGDMVRFAKWEELSTSVVSGNTKKWHLAPKDHLGVLVEYDKLMGTAHVLHDGVIHKIRAVFVEKAGKRDYEKRRQG